jgi:hypothetical protein
MLSEEVVRKAIKVVNVIKKVLNVIRRGFECYKKS